MGGPVPHAWLEGCLASHRRLEALVDRVDDDVAARPSLLPGWTVGHLLTHLARNADALAGMTRAARAGEVGAQYPGGAPQRIADIDAGHARSAAELRVDVVESLHRLERAWADTAPEVWATGLGTVLSGPKTIAEMVFRRWREVEVHGVDLALTDLEGPDWEGLAPAYLSTEWEWTLADVAARLEPDRAVVLVPGDRPSRAFGSGGEPVLVRASPGRILGWLLGRAEEPAWPRLGPWAR